MREVLFVPVCSLYEDRLQIYEKNLLRDGTVKKDNRETNKPINKKYTGVMTKSGKKTIERRLTSWLLAMESYRRINNYSLLRTEHQPVFITLTLSQEQIHDDKWIKRNMLQVFLKDLAYNYDIVNYFWKAEKQKNGNIHFHILVDKYIHMDHIQKVWNRIQQKHDYTQVYQSVHGHHNPPSTHVEGKPKNSSLIKYMLKYVSKHDNTQKISGSVFRFSQSLLSIKPFNEIVMGEFSDTIQIWLDSMEKRAYINDFCTVYYFKKDLAIKDLPDRLREIVDTYYYRVYNDIYSATVKKRLVKQEILKEMPKPKQVDLFPEDGLDKHSRFN